MELMSLRRGGRQGERGCFPRRAGAQVLSLFRAKAPQRAEAAEPLEPGACARLEIMGGGAVAMSTFKWQLRGLTAFVGHLGASLHVLGAENG